jgi:hypothetical protein
MPTNFYFQSGESIGTLGEQRLIEDLIIESVKIYGQDVYYLPRMSFREDKILGEDTLNYFNQAYPIEMYLNNVQGWEGNGEIFSKFGLSVTDQATFVVAKRRWEDAIQTQIDKFQMPKRPLEGDLLYYPKTKALFEIKFVQHLDPFMQLGKFYIYSLNCELYKYSSEILDTGIEAIDRLETKYSMNLLDHALLAEDGKLILSENNFPLLAEDDEPFFTGDSELFQTEGAKILDFSISNPFGEL